MKKSDVLFLNHILDAIADIEKSTHSLSRSEFESNKDIKDATIRRIEIIGEAVKNLSKDIKAKYPRTEWKKIAGTRDVVIHSYFNVDWDLVWDILKKDLNELKKHVEDIVKNEE